MLHFSMFLFALFGVALSQGALSASRYTLFPSAIKQVNSNFEGQVQVRGKLYNVTNGILNYQANGTGSRYHDKAQIVTPNQTKLNFENFAFVGGNGSSIDWYVVLPEGTCLYVQFNSTEARCADWRKLDDTYLQACQLSFSNLTNSTNSTNSTQGGKGGQQPGVKGGQQVQVKGGQPWGLQWGQQPGVKGGQQGQVKGGQPWGQQWGQQGGQQGGVSKNATNLQYNRLVTTNILHLDSNMRLKIIEEIVTDLDKNSFVNGTYTAQPNATQLVDADFKLPEGCPKKPLYDVHKVLMQILGAYQM